MTTYTLETHDLTYHFRQDEKVLDTIALQVPAGAIYGFPGPNGAGKTTTLKLVLGLLRNQQGTIRIFGKEMIHERMTILQRIGSLIESPSLYHHLTAVENLQVLQKLYGLAPATQQGNRYDDSYFQSPVVGNRKVGYACGYH